MSEEVLLRPAVLLILQDGQGRVLVGERRDFPGCWQFPQGGRKKDETNLEALRRETWEEIGLSASAYSDPASLGIWAYRFPPGVKKKRYGGQELVVFVAEYLGPPGWEERFAGSAEFSRIAWMVPREIPLEQLPDFKRSFYEAVLAEWSLAMNVTELSQSRAAGGR